MIPDNWNPLLDLIPGSVFYQTLKRELLKILVLADSNQSSLLFKPMHHLLALVPFLTVIAALVDMPEEAVLTRPFTTRIRVWRTIAVCLERSYPSHRRNVLPEMLSGKFLFPGKDCK
jgi:hypothetical protein